MEYYSTIKRNEVLIHATIWMNLENMLSERSQTQKATYLTVPLIRNARTGKSIETESRLVVARSWGRENGSDY